MLKFSFEQRCPPPLHGINVCRHKNHPVHLIFPFSLPGLHYFRLQVLPTKPIPTNSTCTTLHTYLPKILPPPSNISNDCRIKSKALTQPYLSSPAASLPSPSVVQPLGRFPVWGSSQTLPTLLILLTDLECLPSSEGCWVFQHQDKTPPALPS